MGVSAGACEINYRNKKIYLPWELFLIINAAAADRQERSAAVMKVSGKILLCILIWSGFSASCCEAAVYHSDGSPANVQFIHNTQAVDGDTITLPAGTFSWTTYVTITKAVTIQGQTTTDSSSGTFDDNTIILDNVNRASGEGGTIIKIESVNGKSYRVSGITFSSGAVSDDSGSGAIKLMGDSHAVRFDHCHFGGMVHQAIYIAVWGAIQGVIDHNVMAFEHGQSQSFYIGMGNWGGRTNGHGSWADPPYYGSEKFIFIEDNYLINTSGHEFAGNTDGSRGGRSVFRHNRCYDIEMQGHGTEAEYYRGERCKEIYNNEFHFTNKVSAGGVRSGGLITHDNTWYGALLYGGMEIQAYRTFFRGVSSPWGGASGDNPWDYNVTEPDGSHVDGHPPFRYESGTVSSAAQTTLTDNTKNWTTNQWAGYTLKRLSDKGLSLISSNTNNTLVVVYYTDRGGIIWGPGDQYQIHRVLISMDQPCRGKGDLVSGDDLHPVNSTTGTQSWTHDALEPCYSWKDVHSPDDTPVNIRVRAGQFPLGLFVQGRDYFNQTLMPGYRPYTYPHPLTTSLPPPQPTQSATPSPQNQSHNKQAKKVKRWKWGRAKESSANERAAPDY